MKASIVKITNGFGRTVPIVKYEQDSMIAGIKYPLIVFLHGRGEYSDNENIIRVHPNLSSNENLNHTNILKEADIRKNFIVLAPQFIQAYNYDYKDGIPYQSWQPDWAGGYYVEDVIDWAIANLSIDPKKIYITGLSSGGSGAWDVILKRLSLTDKIAAIAPLCGGYANGDWDLPVLSSVPVWAFHGLKDSTSTPNSSIQQIEKLNQRGINPQAKLTLYPDMGHSIWSTVYEYSPLYDWLLSQINNNIITPPIKKIIAKLYVSSLEVIVYDDKTTEVKEITI